MDVKSKLLRSRHEHFGDCSCSNLRKRVDGEGHLCEVNRDTNQAYRRWSTVKGIIESMASGGARITSAEM